MNLNKIESSIAKILNDAGYNIVRIKHDKSNLEIMIELVNGDPISIRDCSRATKMVTPILFDLLGEGFFLEISSPGVNRPLVKVEDYKKYSGSKISVVFAEMNEKKNVKCVGKLHFEGDNSENGYNIFITDIESKEKTETEYKIDLENVVHCELFVDKNEFTKEFTKSKKEQR